MRFSAVVIAAVSLVAPALGFAPNAFVSKNVAVSQNNGVTESRSQGKACGAFCTCISCVQSWSHPTGCACGSCGTKLFMSEVTEEVPAEVASMDGVNSDEEAHNADRPARGSGIHKHKKGSSGGIALSEVEVGSTVQGTVKGITSYGAFLDIGTQTDALLHVSRMSDDFVANVEDVVKKGDVVSVRIVSVDLEKSQIAVTMQSEEAEAAKAQQKSGGKRKERPRRSGGDRQAQMATLASLDSEGFDSDKFIEGEVVSMLDFGAFVRVDASQLGESITGELDGLVHISSLAVGRTENVSDVVSVGDKVQVRVKNVDADGGKVSLSMIAAADEQAPRRRGGGGGDDGPKRRARAMFSDSELGAKDWKESVESFDQDQPTFANMPIIVDNRK